VWASAIVVANVLAKDPLQVGLREGDKEVEALPTNGSDEPLAIGIRLGCSNGRPQNADTEAFQRRVQARREDGVAVVDDEAVGMIERQELAELLSRPLGSGMRSHVRVENAPRTYLHCDEDIQDAERSGHRNEKSQATIACASPHVGFSRAIRQISSRRFFGSAGRPGLRDFHARTS